MHGLVFAALRDYLGARLGAERADAVFAGEPLYRMTESYPDAAFAALAERARALADRPLDEFLRDFGAYTGETTFARLYPAYFEVAGDCRTFLLTIEERIHELVRATIPDALPPQLRTESAGEDGVRIHYDSPRRLCRLLEGLVAGTAARYGERAEIVEEACVFRGGAECTFHVRLAG